VGKVIFRGLISRWGRLVLAAAAVALGVSSVAGTLILADSVHHSYAALTRQVSAGVDVYVRGPEIDRRQGISDFAPVPNSLLAQVRATHGTSQAQGQIVRVAQLIRTDGRFLDTGATYVYSWPASAQLSPFALVAGRAPVGPGEVVIDRAIAGANRLDIGDAVRVSIDVKTPQTARVTGLVTPRLGGDLSGAAAVFVAAPWAQRLLGVEGRWDLIEVAAARGVSAVDLSARIGAILPDDGSKAVTSRQYADAQITNLTRRAGSVTAILLALSLLAVLVAVGVILGTFSILVTERTRELALLRVMGMTDRQVHASVVAEGALVGLVASGVGALGGIPASFALRAAVALAGRGVRVNGLHVNPLTLGLIALAGAATTMAIATVPARRAMRVGPLEGWRKPPDLPVPATSRLRRAVIPGLLGIGAGAVGAGLLVQPSRRSALMTAGGVALAVGIVSGLPPVSRLLLGRMARRSAGAGAAAAVAAAGARRHPRRTTAPAASLVLGLLMVTTVAVLAASAHATISDLVLRADRADLVVASDAAPGIDPETVQRVREAPSVSVATELGTDRFTIRGRDATMTALDTDTAQQSLHLAVFAGTLDRFADGSIAVSRTAATSGSHPVRVGDLIPVRFGRPQVRYLRVAAILADNGITRDWVVPFETYRLGYLSAPIRTVFVKAQPGTSAEQLRRQVDAAVAGFPGIQVKDAAAYARSEARRAEGPVALVQALVGLAIVIALLGVANTLSLSVVERGPELGMLRVLGMTPRQLSLTVHWQALYIALLGTSFGLAAGLALGLSLAAALDVHGITHLVVPATSLAIVSALVVASALVAAAIPARRAAHLGRLRALPGDA
jgi:putative ABC transport system permease protein